MPAYEPEYPALYSDLIDLFEYKVADLAAGRLSGKAASLRELRDYLLAAPLDPPLVRRMRQLDKQWRSLHSVQHNIQPKPVQPAPLQPAALQGDLPPLLHAETEATTATTSGRNEWQVLAGLRGTLYQFQLQQAAQEQGRAWARQKHLPTLRLALALAQVLEQRQGAAPMPSVLPVDYADLRLPEKAAQVLGVLTQRLWSPLGEASGRVKQWRAALQALLPQLNAPNVLGIKALKDEQHEQEVLTHLLDKLLSHAQQDQLASVDAAQVQPLLLQAVTELTEYLERCVPLSLGGRGEELPLLGGLLYARTPALRLTRPDEGSLSLAIYLPGGDRAQWRGEELFWRRLGADSAAGWEVVIGQPSSNSADFIRLSPQQPLAESRLGGVPVYLALLGDDLALSCVPPEHSDLSAQVYEAHLVGALLDPAQDYAALRLARAVAMAVRGKAVDPNKVNPASAKAYRAAAPGELLAFARQGVQTLISALASSPEAVQRAFEVGAQAAGVAPEGARHLLQLLGQQGQFALPRLHDYRSVSLQSAAEQATFFFRGEPLSVRVLGQVLTLRSGPTGQLMASMPGQPAAVVGDLLVLPTAQGSVLVVHAGERVVVGVQPAGAALGGGAFLAE